MGVSASRNKLIEMAHGEYLDVFDHDDISYPEKDREIKVCLTNWCCLKSKKTTKFEGICL